MGVWPRPGIATPQETRIRVRLVPYIRAFLGAYPGPGARCGRFKRKGILPPEETSVIIGPPILARDAEVPATALETTPFSECSRSEIDGLLGQGSRQASQ